MTFPSIPPTSPSIPFLPLRRKSWFGLWALAGAWLLAPCAPCPAQPEVFSPAQREAALAQLRREGVLPAIALELPLWSVPVLLPVTVPLTVPLTMPVWEPPSAIQLSALKLEFPEMPAPLAIESAIARQIADQYALAGDERAVSHYEQLLAAVEKQGPQEIEVPEVAQLAEFYKATGQPAKAAEVLARTARYMKSPAYIIGNSMVEAARLYREAGDEVKANEMYRKVIETPSEWGWAKGIAIYELSSALITAGRHKEAQGLLSTPFGGAHAEQIQIALVSLLARSYYASGDLERARQASGQVAVLVAKAGTVLGGEGLEEQVEAARQMEEWSAKWQKSGLVVEPVEIRLACVNGGVIIGH